MTEYVEEQWAVTKTEGMAAICGLEIGIENSQELLAEHDAKYKRELRSHRMDAERMEDDIRVMSEALSKLKIYT